MTSEARTLERRAAPLTLRDWMIVFRSAGKTMLRSFALVAAVIILARVRTETNIAFHAAMVPVAVGLIYVAVGASFRLWALYIVGFILFAQLRSRADELGIAVQYDYPVVADEVLFFGVLPTQWLQEQFYSVGRLGVAEAFFILVYTSYFFTPHILAVALWKFDRERFAPYCLAFILLIYAGIVASAIVPTAPPWLASVDGNIGEVHRVLPEISQNITPGTYETTHASVGENLVAAMPSLHVAVPCLMAIALWKYRRLRLLGALYPLAMTGAVVYLGEHYVVDALAGLAFAAAAWWAALRLIGWWQGRAGKHSAETPVSGQEGLAGGVSA